MGLDLGTKTIGVAVSDTGRGGSPRRSRRIRRTKLRRRRRGAARARRRPRRIAGLVLGLPRNMDGSEGPRAQSTRAFARNLAGLTELPITFWDERLSTVAAERALLEADASRRRRAEVIDHVAAGLILQGLLDRLGAPGAGGAMSDEVWRRDEIESPCVKVCVVAPGDRALRRLPPHDRGDRRLVRR